MVLNNVQLFLSLHIRFLKYLGIWRTEKSIKIYCFYQVFALCLQWSVILFTVIYMRCVWGDLESMSMGLYVLFSHCSTCLKMTSIVVNRKKIFKILEVINCDTFAAQTEEQQKILAAQSRKMRRLYYFWLGVVTLNVLEWMLIPVVDREGPRTYPLTMWMPGNIENSPDYELGYLHHAIFAFAAAYIFITTDAFTITMISFGCAQLDIVKHKIKKIQRVSRSIEVTQAEREDILEDNNKLLTDCISHHQAIIRLIASVVECFNFNIFFQFSVTVGIVCIIAFRLSIEPPNTFKFYNSINYMMSMVAQLFFYCWNGSELTTRSEELRDALYECPWYEQDAKFRRKLCFAMECMKKPIVFIAGHYITLSRPTFITILRCSYSYFAVLNHFNNSQ